MAKPASFDIKNTNSWGAAREFVTLPVVLENRRGSCIVMNTELQKNYGLRSENYELVRHEEALDAFAKALLELKPGSSCKLISAQLDSSGARMHLHVEIDAGEDFHPRLTLTNSYDGTLSLGLDVGLRIDDTVANLDSVERWVHFGNRADSNELKTAIKKALKAVTDRWAPKIVGLSSARLDNPRLSVEWFQEKKFINQEIAEAAIAMEPRNGYDLFLAMCAAITNYESSPTRKRDMYHDVIKALFTGQKWAAAVDKRRKTPENNQD